MEWNRYPSLELAVEREQIGSQADVQIAYARITGKSGKQQPVDLGFREGDVEMIVVLKIATYQLFDLGYCTCLHWRGPWLGGA